MRRTWTPFAVALALAGWLSSEGLAQATPRDGIVAIVGSQPILASDLIRIANGWRAQWRAMGVTDDGFTEDALLQEALDSRITQVLLIAEARRLEIAVTPAMIDEELAARAKAQGGTVAALGARSGATEASTREWAQGELLRRALLRHAYPYHRTWTERPVRVPDIGLPRIVKQEPNAMGQSDFDRLLSVYIADLKARGTITIEIKGWR